ncbi:MAG: MarR family transcriptional regulator [Marinosulfonomonas sp.]|nr:MarR family transcriptional regulator [Marinosulfonomonas sp.]
MQNVVSRSDTDTDEEYRLDEQIGHILRRASQRHASIFQARMADLTPTQFAAVIKLAEIGECSQNRLGRLTAMDVATIKGVVDRLHKKGFVTLRPDQTDKRRTLISLTQNGVARIDELHRTGASISSDTLDPLSTSERRNFLRLLQKIT